MANRGLLWAGAGYAALIGLFAYQAHGDRHQGNVSRDVLPLTAPLATDEDDVVFDHEEDVIPGEVAVDLRDDVSDADVADLQAKYHFAMRPASAWSATHDKLEVADVEPADEPAL